MATRTVYVPDRDSDLADLVHEHEVDFQWVSGGSVEQKKTNIAKLHAAAAHRNLKPLLEVSSFTEDPLGILGCPENLTVKDDRSYLVSVLAIYHGSKVFSDGGPYHDLFRRSKEDILADRRLKNSGPLIGYRFMGLEWGLKSGTMFYDWLVVHAIARQPKLRARIGTFKGFTDIGCRSGEKAPCHAKSCALYLALAEKNFLDRVIGNQDAFINTLVRDSSYQP